MTRVFLGATVNVDGIAEHVTSAIGHVTRSGQAVRDDVTGCLPAIPLLATSPTPIDTKIDDLG